VSYYKEKEENRDKNIKRKDTSLHKGIRILQHNLDIREIPLGYSQVCS
jgi:hypothetical protein